MRPTPLTQAGVCGGGARTLGRNLKLCDDDTYAQIVKTRSPVKQMSCDYEAQQMRGLSTDYAHAHQTYDYPPTQRETIERYIAVPISSTDHLLISSTGSGQHYLAEPVSALLGERLQERLQAAAGYAAYTRYPPPALTEAGDTYDKPPPPLPAPGYERPAPLGASSRATSKMSLDCLDQETPF